MIRTIEEFIVSYSDEDYARFLRLAGLSTDTKPTGNDIATGSVFEEVDTGDKYYFVESGDSGSWVIPGA